MPTNRNLQKSESKSVKRSGKTPKNAELLLVDLSSSMDTRVQTGDGQMVSKYSLVCQALKPYAKTAHAIAFNSAVFEVDPDQLPSPYGFTAAHLAIERATTLEPLHCLFISDGEPDSETNALDAARYLAEQCIIDVLYIGPADGEKAIAFMKELANIGRGRFKALDLDNPAGVLAIGNQVNQMLALPSPDNDAIKL